MHIIFDMDASLNKRILVIGYFSSSQTERDSTNTNQPEWN